MSQRAFALRPEFEDLSGASIAYGPHALTFDVHAALEAGDGTIVVDDAQLADRLVEHAALSEVQVVPQDAVIADPPSLEQVQEAAQAAADAVPEFEPTAEVREAEAERDELSQPFDTADVLDTAPHDQAEHEDVLVQEED
jgi:hypothetical protein